MSIPKAPPEFDNLSTSEKIDFVQLLWERIAEEADVAELTDTQRDELHRRLEAHRKDTGTVIPWEQVRRRVGEQEASI